MPTNGNTFLPIGKFNTTQKKTWTSTTCTRPAARRAAATPTRGALAKAGRYYAGQFVSSSVPDPIQYSCQQNFTVLVTDGYWNTDDESSSCSSGSKYSACKISSGSVGDQDGVSGVARPYFDGLGVSNSLADIAYYLLVHRPSLDPPATLAALTEEGTNIDISTNNVPPAGTDTATWQHMNTFAVGLGVPGVLNYAENYLQGGSSDYNAILQGTKNWPDPKTSSGTSSVPARLDDLWHAAVNGRGQYLSVKTPSALTSALGKALSSIAIRNGSGAAAATSNLEPVSGDNFAFVPQYTTSQWTGDLLGRTIDLTTGGLSGTNLFSAATSMLSQVAATSDTRAIYTYSAAASNKLKTFVTANLTAEKTANYFKSSSTNPGGALSQYGGFNNAQQLAATDDAMIAFIRGQSGNEIISTNTNQLFRQRQAVLGDIVSSKPVYVKLPPFKYSDTGYAAFLTAQASRASNVYVGANDGMLHAFDATNGNERWAYIPSTLIPQLYKLADAAYGANHQFYADGPIIVGDAYNGSAWKTVLVGGLGRGGRGYYAIDVTDPASPVALMGVRHRCRTATSATATATRSSRSARPTSSVGGAGELRRYNEHEPRRRQGAALHPRRVHRRQARRARGERLVERSQRQRHRQMAAWVDDALIQNSTQYVYAGDLSGNLWRFDITGTAAAQRLGYTSATAGNQPITMRPQLGQVKDSAGVTYKAVFFGTGRYLGFSDLTPSSPSQTVAQTIYAVKDTGADLGVLSSAGAKLTAQTLNTGSTPRTIATPATVNWSTGNGWYMTLPVGERMTIDPALQLGTFVIPSNIPDSTYCAVGGIELALSVQLFDGAAPCRRRPRRANGQQTVGSFTGNALIVGLSLIQLPAGGSGSTDGGGGKTVGLVSTSDTKVLTPSVLDLADRHGVAAPARLARAELCIPARGTVLLRG